MPREGFRVKKGSLSKSIVDREYSHHGSSRNLGLPALSGSKPPELTSKRKLKVRIGSPDTVGRGLLPLSAVKKKLKEGNKSSDFKNLDTINNAVTEVQFNNIIQAMCKHEQKILLAKRKKETIKDLMFKTEFYRDLVDDMSASQPTIRYKRVEPFTKKFVGAGHTIFECYHRIVVPICEIIEGCERFRVVIIETKENKLIYFDPMHKKFADKDFMVKHSKYIKAIGDYIKKEFKERANQIIDIKQYMITVAPSPQLTKIEESGIWTLFFIHQSMKGGEEPDFADEQLRIFRNYIGKLE